MEAFWAFLLCVAYVPGGLPPAAEIGRAAVLLLGPALFLPRRVERWDWLLVVLLGWAALGLLWTPAGLLGLGKFLELGAAVCLVLARPNLDGVMKGMVWGLVVNDIFLLLQLAGLHPVQEVATPSGLFMNRDFLAELASLVLLWGIVWQRGLAISVAALPLLVCQSRVAWMMLTVGLLFGLPRRWRWAAATPLGAVALLWTVGGKVESAWARLEGWKAGLQLLSWKGLGLGFFEFVSPNRQLIHSDLLQIGDELGLIGLLVLALWLAGRRWLLEEDRALGAATVLALLVAFPLHLPANAAVVAAVLGSSRPRFQPRLASRRGRIEEGLVLEVGR